MRIHVCVVSYSFFTHLSFIHHTLSLSYTKNTLTRPTALNLVQVNQLVTSLKDKFGFVDAPVMAAAAAPAAGGEAAGEKCSVVQCSAV
jgi:ribosomal protein L7/L12